jgi:hypothetical protein
MNERIAVCVHCGQPVRLNRPTDRGGSGRSHVGHVDYLRDTTCGATCWDLSEAEALVLDRLMRTGESATARTWEAQP